MFSRAILRSTLNNTKNNNKQIINSFHVGSQVNYKSAETEVPMLTKADYEAEAAKERPGILNKMGLDDWKVSVPVGAAIAFPAVANEWYMLSEETQLIFCFGVFSGAAYKFASQMMADSLDADQNAIIAEFNKLEDLKCEKLRNEIAFWKPHLNAVDYIEPLKAKHYESYMKANVVATQKKKYELTDTALKTLNNFMLLKSQSDEAKIATFLDSTSAETLSGFSTNAKLKKAAIDQVFAILEAPDADHPDVAYLAMVESSKKFESAMTAEDPALKAKLENVLKEGQATMSSIV